MSRPKWQEKIPEKPIACLASSLASMVRTLPQSIQSATWYGSDILLNNQCRLNQFQQLQAKKIGSTQYLLGLLEEADQFQSGVLLALPHDQGGSLSGTFYTEDEQYRDIGDALLEIRAFDTTFWVVYGQTDYIRKLVQVFASEKRI